MDGLAAGAAEAPERRALGNGAATVEARGRGMLDWLGDRHRSGPLRTACPLRWTGA
ncbi:Hypothetical protein AA314_03412 [Archangium gephyra]|uniref:Uncharacterized protein n=1 Tax=Archangium gephyra TaxID=48 RepID=A0AAC8TEQ2_9BACT|nr:Hypothetical protein AA314_03412 [Archangium gephyra]